MARTEKQKHLNNFLAEVETSAFKIARSMLRDDEAALDATQDAMFKFVQKYADKPHEDWNALFFRIVQNQSKDVLRKRKIKHRVFGWLGSAEYDEVLDRKSDFGSNPEMLVSAEYTRRELQTTMQCLPNKQKEVLQLRLYEQMKLETIAQTMEISIGSVKSHLSRAMQKLKPILNEQNQETVKP